ncbi:MAG: hypothetical protein QOG03_455 [Actinomycetota bacterium]|jgi:hypothetical protein|nr:hypothetical protein [Actinomycetota bacterium]
MRKKISLALATLFALAGLAAFAPAAHARADLPSVRRDQCGNINVYDSNGNPMFEYVSMWCGPSPE